MQARPGVGCSLPAPLARCSPAVPSPGLPLPAEGGRRPPSQSPERSRGVGHGFCRSSWSELQKLSCYEEFTFQTCSLKGACSPSLEDPHPWSPVGAATADTAAASLEKEPAPRPGPRGLEQPHLRKRGPPVWDPICHKAPASCDGPSEQRSQGSTGRLPGWPRDRRRCARPPGNGDVCGLRRRLPPPGLCLTSAPWQLKPRSSPGSSQDL